MHWCPLLQSRPSIAPALPTVLSHLLFPVQFLSCLVTPNGRLLPAEALNTRLVLAGELEANARGLSVQLRSCSWPSRTILRAGVLGVTPAPVGNSAGRAQVDAEVAKLVWQSGSMTTSRLGLRNGWNTVCAGQDSLALFDMGFLYNSCSEHGILAACVFGPISYVLCAVASVTAPQLSMALYANGATSVAEPGTWF